MKVWREAPSGDAGLRPAPCAGQASGAYATLAKTIDELARCGFIEHFGVSGDALRSFDSGRTFSAGQVVIREYHRFEGVSDPDDMSIVFAIEGQGGARGTLVDAFGAYSDPTVSAFLQAVAIGRAGPMRSREPASEQGVPTTARSWTAA